MTKLSLGSIFSKAPSALAVRSAVEKGGNPFVKELHVEGARVEDYIKAQEANIKYLKGRIALYNKIVKRLKKMKKHEAAAIFKADMQTMGTTIGSIKKELKQLRVKLEALGIILKEEVTETTRKLLENGSEAAISKLISSSIGRGNYDNGI